MKPKNKKPTGNTPPQNPYAFPPLKKGTFLQGDVVYPNKQLVPVLEAWFGGKSLPAPEI